MIKYKNKGSYNFTDRVHSKDGIIATVFAGISFILLICLIVRAFFLKGELSVVYGFVGMISFLLAVVGFGFGISSYKDEESYFLFKNIGTIFNILLLIIYIMIIIAGM